MKTATKRTDGKVYWHLLPTKGEWTATIDKGSDLDDRHWASGNYYNNLADVIAADKKTDEISMQRRSK